MSILVTGGNTSIGIELQQHHDDILLPSQNELDLTNSESIKSFFKKNDISVVINNNFLMNVRKCEEEKTKAMKINVTSTQNLFNVIQSQFETTKFFHISTPCVFNGKESMFSESSIPYPVNFYGLTRLLGETIVRQLKHFCIIRTNYVSKTKWTYPKAFTDRFGTYLFTEQVAQGILDLIHENVQGIYHLVGAKRISMYDLAKITTPDIEPMTIADYSGPSLNMDMSLDSKKWKKYDLI